jgi:CBS domain-containing protein
MAMERPISELIREAGVLIHTRPKTTVQAAATTMSEHNVGSIVVIDDDRNPVGIFTERDLLNRVVAEGIDPETTPLSEVMTTDLVIISGDTARGRALNIMQENHIRHLPVADDDELVGIVSLRDLLSFEMKRREQEVEQLREYVYEKPYPAYPA